MNKAAINKTIECMRNSSTFTMAWIFTPECGTPACIAGHVLYANTPDAVNIRDPHSIARAQSILDISRVEGSNLFEPNTTRNKFHWNQETRGASDTITQAHAIACLERFRDTGKVDWQASKRDCNE